MQRIIFMIITATLIGCSTYNQRREFRFPRTDRTIATNDVRFDNKTDIVLKTINLTITSTNTDKALDSILQIATSNNGSVQSSDHFSANFRVIDSVYERVVLEIENIGTVIAKSVGGNDSEFELDNSKSRLKDARENLDRCVNAIDSSKDVPNIAMAIREISRLNNEINRDEFRVGKLESNDFYAKILVRVKQERSPGPFGWFFGGIYKGIRWLFVQP